MKRENRRAFFERINGFLTEDELLEVEIAYLFAKSGHRRQSRKEVDPTTGRPQRYFEHPRGVVIILMDEVCCYDAQAIAAGWLHDAVEDTRISEARIKRHFCAGVVRIVRDLTKPPKSAGMSAAAYVARMLSHNNWRTLIVKCCDRLHNMRSLGGCDEAFQRKQVKETRELYFAVFDRAVQIVPKKYKKGAEKIRAEIHRIVAQYEGSLRLKG